MTEDEVYRTTTQYRLWSYTQETLATLRVSTNSRAAVRVRDALRRRRSYEEKDETASVNQVNCLTVEEEQKLVGFYCVKAMEFADFCEFPTNVKVSPG